MDDNNPDFEYLEDDEVKREIDSINSEISRLNNKKQQLYESTKTKSFENQLRKMNNYKNKKIKIINKTSNTLYNNILNLSEVTDTEIANEFDKQENFEEKLTLSDKECNKIQMQIINTENLLDKIINKMGSVTAQVDSIDNSIKELLLSGDSNCVKDAEPLQLEKEGLIATLKKIAQQRSLAIDKKNNEMKLLIEALNKSQESRADRINQINNLFKFNRNSVNINLLNEKLNECMYGLEVICEMPK